MGASAACLPACRACAGWAPEPRSALVGAGHCRSVPPSQALTRRRLTTPSKGFKPASAPIHSNGRHSLLTLHNPNRQVGVVLCQVSVTTHYLPLFSLVFLSFPFFSIASRPPTIVLTRAGSSSPSLTDGRHCSEAGIPPSRGARIFEPVCVVF